jgi:hypothetical protein
VPSLDLIKLSQYFRTSVVAFFLKRTLINQRLARNMLDWTLQMHKSAGNA